MCLSGASTDPLRSKKHAFLAPNLVKAAIEGRLPRGIGVERLRDPPTEWSRQFEALGLNPEQ
jgi:site-specific DNA recombinase